MAKRVYASVKPAILVWARTSAGFTIEAAAKALKLDMGVLVQWEAGESLPSVPQLRNLAGLYKRPLAAFYLQEIPLLFQVLTDLRRPVPGEDRAYSPALTQEIRSAQQRRELAIDLRNELEEPIEQYPFRLHQVDNELAGETIRKFLGISIDDILRYGRDPTGRIGFNTWRNALEKSGVLVFQSARVPQSEASGFALAFESMPVVVINQKDIPQRRLFSLIHEFAHVALRESGVSDLKLDGIQIQAPDIEVRCNSIASAALMPRNAVLAALDEALAGKNDLTDDLIVGLARRFGVSRPALLVRLIHHNRTTWDFYFEKVAQYTAEFERQKAARPPAVDIKRNMAQESLSNLGRPFVGLVLDNYHQRRLTLSDVAGYLGIRVKHVETLERRFVG